MNEKSVILHVEDDPNDVLLVDLAFRKAGLPVSLTVVHDGDQAIEYLSGQGRYLDRLVYPIPAIVLLDLKLPRRSGLEVLAWVRGREDLRRMLVVMLTSSNQPTDVNRAYDLGANSYLVKPSALEQLVNMIRQFSGYWLATNVRPLLQVDELAPG